MGALMVLSAVAALGTQSRGALIAIVAMAGMLWWRNRNKAVFGVLIAIIGIGIVAFMPSTWESRMMSITEYEQDGSAMGRINAWWMAWNLAKANFIGGGFDIYEPAVFQAYAPNPTDVHAAHSIYFQVLGEHGFVGLILFVAIWIAVWRSARRDTPHGRVTIRQTAWVADLGSMCQVSLVGYLVGGMFLSLAYFDLPYNVLVLVVAARRWLAERRAEGAAGVSRPIDICQCIRRAHLRPRTPHRERPEARVPAHVACGTAGAPVDPDLPSRARQPRSVCCPMFPTQRRSTESSAGSRRGSTCCRSIAPSQCSRAMRCRSAQPR